MDKNKDVINYYLVNTLRDLTQEQLAVLIHNLYVRCTLQDDIDKKIEDYKKGQLHLEKLATIARNNLQEDVDKALEDSKHCTCGNPSKLGSCYFEGDEELIYFCNDCGKKRIPI